VQLRDFFEINFSTRIHCLRAVTPSPRIAARAVSADVARCGSAWPDVAQRRSQNRMYVRALCPGCQTGSQPDQGSLQHLATSFRWAALSCLPRWQRAADYERSVAGLTGPGSARRSTGSGTTPTGGGGRATRAPPPWWPSRPGRSTTAGTRPTCGQFFTSVRTVATLSNPYRIRNQEFGGHVYLCTEPRHPWGQMWPRLRSYG
jgi:hypothetical protein